MNRCRICRRRPGNVGGRFHFCAPCVEQVQDDCRCGDCDSEVTVVIPEGATLLYVHVGHDDTCPAWRARRDVS